MNTKHKPEAFTLTTLQKAGEALTAEQAARQTAEAEAAQLRQVWIGCARTLMKLCGQRSEAQRNGSPLGASAAAEHGGRKNR